MNGEGADRDREPSRLDRLDDPLERMAEARARRWYELGRSSSWIVRQAYRMIVLVVGLSFVALGLVLIVLPGPLTIPPILLGLGILATEFVWARRLLERAKVYAGKAKGRAKGLTRRKT